jgi:hypothetical protein
MKSLLTALTLTLAALPSFAQEATVINDSFQPTRSRAEVRAEVVAALARGERLSYGEAHIPTGVTRPVSTLTRAQVQGEVLAALARGERLSYGEADARTIGA